jgi:hypothetical protein
MPKVGVSSSRRCAALLCSHDGLLSAVHCTEGDGGGRRIPFRRVPGVALPTSRRFNPPPGGATLTASVSGSGVLRGGSDTVPVTVPVPSRSARVPAGSPSPYALPVRSRRPTASAASIRR